MNSDSPPFKLSLWKDYVPQRTLIATQVEENGAAPKVISQENLQEEIYSWHTLEDPFGGVIDPELRQKLHHALVERLNPSLPPSQRRIDVLKEFALLAEKAIVDHRVKWIWGHGASQHNDSIIEPLNSLLALKLHVDWLLTCFTARPGISVSVR
ncbi:MAG: hypothetical protein OXC26_15630 [Albidovulum sp.]|nr:hypothetical protein [Albidovulum sp.]